jgi:hypothetical protein
LSWWIEKDVSSDVPVERYESARTLADIVRTPVQQQQTAQPGFYQPNVRASEQHGEGVWRLSPGAESRSYRFHTAQCAPFADKRLGSSTLVGMGKS